MTRVLMVVDTLGASGAERQLLSLLPGLRHHGVEVEVAALMPPYTVAPTLEARGVRVHRLDLPHRWALARSGASLKRLILEGEYEVVWSTLYCAHIHTAVFRALAGAPPLVLWHQSPGYSQPVYGSYWGNRFRRFFHGHACRIADKVVACSRAVAADFERSFALGPLPVIYNAVPPNELPGPITAEQRAEVRRRRGVDDGTHMLTVAARYSLDKGHRYLIDAMALLVRRGLRPVCIAAGAGPLEKELRARAAEMGVADTFHLVGPLPQGELFQLMQASDAVVLPSIQESLGLAAIEAMALGVPVVVSDYYGLVELAEGEAAFTARPADPQNLADALERALTDVGSRRRVVARARERVESHFSVPVILPRWAELLRDAAGVDGARRRGAIR